jgi:polysaccharide biosynthesis protein PslH
MKILFLTSRFPYPLEKGDKLRSYYLLRELSLRNEVILVSLNETNVEKEHVRVLEKMVSKVYVFHLSWISRYLNTFFALFMKRPLQAGYFYNRRVRKSIQQIIIQEKPDHVLCQLLRTALYVKGLSIPKTIDFQDVFSYGVKRRLSVSKFPMNIILSIEYKRLLKFEQELFRSFDHSLIITEADRDLMPVAEKEKIHIISNGVDHKYFNNSFYSDIEKNYDLLFTGNMGYPPNVDCAHFIVKKVLPLVIKEFPSIKLALAGAAPHPSLQKLNSANVTVTGWVEDMRKMYASSEIFLAPMQIGTGLQNKLLEAMSMNMPCVTSPLANSALKAMADKDILVGSTPEELAGHIIKLIENKNFAAQIAENGMNYVRNNFSWTAQAELLQGIIEA